jgi:hypothetical protein
MAHTAESGRVPIHVEKSSWESERGRETRVWLGFRGKHGRARATTRAPEPNARSRFRPHRGESGAAVVAPQPGERLAQPRAELDLAQIASEQLQAAVGRERLGHELDREITLDHPSQARYAQTHQRGLQWVRECIGVLSLETALEASLIHVPRSFPSRLFADWG